MQVVGQPRTGGEYGQLRNRRMLKSVIEDVDIVEIPRVNLFVHALNVVFGRGYGYTYKLKRKIDGYLNNKYDFAFIDSSSYGEYVNYLRKRGLKTIVFCHNVEYEYYKAKFESSRTLMNRVLVPYIKKQEGLSMKAATSVITLNHRDTIGIKDLYRRDIDLEIPVFYEPIGKEELDCSITSDYLLFVGADFYANTDGIKWFITNVSNHIKYKLYVVGGCCNTVAKSINQMEFPNVKLLGFVDDLDSLYKKAVGVVCPIFTGSGMKTKTVEALKYGKSVFGTTEAFEGIETDYSKIGGLCNAKEEFVTTINNYDDAVFNPFAYSVFEAQFSINSVIPKFAAFVNSISK